MLAAIDKVLAPLAWIAAAALAVMLIVGPVVVADDKESAATTTPAGASPYATTSTAAPAPAEAADGEQLFIDNCGSCHALSKAGTEGSVGPNLDELAPDAQTVEDVMVSGAGTMPSFEDSLSAEDRAAIAAYVAG
jgi:mono/diheme cytochrome c family protein